MELHTNDAPASVDLDVPPRIIGMDWLQWCHDEKRGQASDKETAH